MKSDLVNTLVSECMTGDLITVGQYASLAEANELMQVHKVRRLPVTDKDRLIGIITQRDILDAKPSDIKQPMNIDALNQFLLNIVVELAMTRDPVTILQTDTLGHAAAVMLDHKIGGIPVTNATGRLTGLITESDIFRVIVRKWRENDLIQPRDA